MKRGFQVLLLSIGLTMGLFDGAVNPAFAGGEDQEIFQADCNGYDVESNTYPKKALCTVELLSATCIPDSSIAPGGYNATVMKRNGRRWTAVTRTTHYDACAPESENGVNRKMRFRITKSGTYRVRLDAVGDHQPAFWATVLAVDLSGDLRTFFLNVRR